MTSLTSKPLFDLRLTLDPPRQLQIPLGTRVSAAISGGSFQGERLSGTVLPGGGDWMAIGADGTMFIDVRAILQTQTGDLIAINYGGRIVVPADRVTQVFDPEQVELVDPASYYFRITPTFEVPLDSPFAWLNGVVAVGVGRIVNGGVVYSVHSID